jgi:hypothetical protein
MSDDTEAPQWEMLIVGHTPKGYPIAHPVDIPEQVYVLVPLSETE